MKDYTVKISKKAKIGYHFNTGSNIFIGDNVIIKDHVTLGNNVIIREGVTLQSYSVIEDNTIIGYNRLTRHYDENTLIKETVIGEYSLIRPNTIVYLGCQIGDHSTLNHNVVVREKTIIGDHTSIGSMVQCNGYLSIGNHCSIHGYTHLPPFMKISDYVFIGPAIVCLNDTLIDYKRDLNSEKKGPTIERGARIGGHSTLCPNIHIGKESFIVAGSLVAYDVPDFAKVAGSPARVIGSMPKTQAINDLL